LFSVDNAIVHKDGEPSFLNFTPEHSVHHHLKCCQGICQSKKHDCGFKKAFQGLECHLPFIPRFYPYVVVSLVDVKFGEESVSHKLIDDKRYEG
jgi:hypothetical protein